MDTPARQRRLEGVGMPADTVLGNVEAGLASAAIRLDQTYTTPMCHHNPMEPHTAVATWPTTC